MTQLFYSLNNHSLSSQGHVLGAVDVAVTMGTRPWTLDPGEREPIIHKCLYNIVGVGAKSLEGKSSRVRGPGRQSMAA